MPKPKSLRVVSWSLGRGIYPFQRKGPHTSEPFKRSRGSDSELSLEYCPWPQQAQKRVGASREVPTFPPFHKIQDTFLVVDPSAAKRPPKKGPPEGAKLLSDPEPNTLKLRPKLLTASLGSVISARGRMGADQ